MSKIINIPGRIHSTEQGNVTTGANEVLDDIKGKKQNVINAETDAELLRLENEKQDNLTFDNTPVEDSTNPITSGGVYASELLIQQVIETILALIPSAASALNQLADKAFVNSTVATASATFRGTYNVVTDLGLAYDATHQEIATALLSHIATADNNDYAFVQIPVSQTSQDVRVTERYKFDGTIWKYEYDLNNSGFTAAQWAAINSTITLALVEKLTALPTASELATALAGKQAVLTFDNTPVSGSANPVKSGGLYELFAAIDAKMPANASANNKLVAEDRLAAYVTAIIGALDATYNVTSTDGHVTFKVTQVNGAITSVQVLTSDIASATALTALGTRVSQNEVDIAALQALYNSLQQSAPVIINPTDTWPVANPSQTVIYRVIDRENPTPAYYCDYMWDGSGTTLADFILMAKYNNAIDAVPTAGSHNLVESGGVKQALDNILYKNNVIQSFAVGADVYHIIFNGCFKNGEHFGFMLDRGSVVAERFQLYAPSWAAIKTPNIEDGVWYDLTFPQNETQNYVILYAINCTTAGNVTAYMKSGDVYGVEKYAKGLETSIGNLDSKIDDNFAISRIGNYQNKADMPISDSADTIIDYFTDRLFKKDESVFVKINKNNCVLSKIYLFTVIGWTNLAEITTFDEWVQVVLPVDTQGIKFYTLPAHVTTAGTLGIEILSNDAVSIVDEKVRAISSVVNHNVITCSRDGVSGVDADFCGLNAIGDALSSINDASETNVYDIYIRGYFKFTNPKMVADGGDFKYVIGNEPSAAFTKKYVNLIGIEEQGAVIEVNLPEGLQETDFPYSETFGRYFTYDDYNPLYILKGCDISNIQIIGRNCRYVSHIEVGGDDNGCIINIDRCTFWEKAGTRKIGCLIAGEIPYFKLNVKNSTFINEDGMKFFGGHTPLSYITNGRENCRVVFDNCDFISKGTLGLTTFEYNRKDDLIFNNCRISEHTTIFVDSTNSVKREIGTLINCKSSGEPRMVRINTSNALSLCIRTLSGSGSSVRFDPSSTAFAIVGDKNKTIEKTLLSGAKSIYGYEYRDDEIGSHAYGAGTINIDPTTGHSLGSILGDCSGTSKALVLTINGTSYTVTFNTNLTSASNSDVLAIINAVIGAVAVAEEKNVEFDEYPVFDNMEYFIENDDNALIERGMGIVKTAPDKMRRAKQSDGHIDGIAIDNIYPSQKGRIINKGVFFNVVSETYEGQIWFTIKPHLTLSYGDSISIDPSNDGKFIVSNTAPVLKAISEDAVKII